MHQNKIQIFFCVADFPAICAFPKNEGDDECGREGETRFYYDYVTGYCRTFEFKGCAGNGNSFGSWTVCSDVCGYFQGRVATANFGGNGSVILSQAHEDNPTVVKGFIQGLEAGRYSLGFNKAGEGHEGCDIAADEVQKSRHNFKKHYSYIRF